MNRSYIQPTVLGLAILMANQAIAENAAETENQTKLEEVTVTAQKREQTLEDIPAYVTPISSETVSDYLSAGENIRALAGRAPSLQIESSNGRQSPRFYIRGLGNYDFDVNATQPVSLVYDEVALENSVLKSFPLFDISQVEVLNGPQGTLFGRSTTAGVVKIDSVKPTQASEDYASIGYGSRGTQAYESGVSVNLADNLDSRVSLKYLKREPWINNTVDQDSDDDFGGFEEFAYRIQLQSDLSETTTALFKLHGFHQSGDQPQVFYANAFTPGTEGLRSGFKVEEAAHDAKSGMDLDHIGASLKLDFIVAGIDVTSITSYDQIESFSQADIDGGLQTFNVGEPNEQAFFSVASGDGLDDHYQFTQELRIHGETDQLFYQTGLYFLKEEILVRSSDFDNAGTPTNVTFVDQITESAAIFGQVDYEVSERVGVTAGMRYTMDDKTLEVVPGTPSFAAADKVTADDGYINWDLATNYQFSDDLTLFSRLATASRGPATLGRFGVVTQADTETITSFEVGYKSEWLDGNVRWNLAAFTYQISDHQLTANGGSDNVNRLLNADKTTGQGIETDLQALLVDSLYLNMNLSYNKTEITDETLTTDLCSSAPGCTSKDPVVDVVPGLFGPRTLVAIDGNPIPRAPELIANIALTYTFEISSGEIKASTDWNYRSDSNIFLYESTEFVAKERWIGGFKVAYENQPHDFTLSLIGRNVTNEIVADGALDFLNMTAFTNEPSYYGLEFSKQF